MIRYSNGGNYGTHGTEYNVNLGKTQKIQWLSCRVSYFYNAEHRTAWLV